MKKGKIIIIFLLTFLLWGCGKEERKMGIGKMESESSVSEEEHFICAIEDIFSLTDRNGTVVVGTVAQGTLHVGDEIQISGINEEVINTTVEGLEIYKSFVDEVSEGMNVGILLGEEVTRDNISKGQVITTKDTVKTAKNFKAYIFVSTEEEGNVNELSLNAEDLVEVRFWSRAIKSTVVLPVQKNMELKPGEQMYEVQFVLENPEVLEVGSSFIIRKEGCFVGAGSVTEVLD